MQETYNIYFAGDIADGESLDEVRRKVGALFNAREATLDKLFSGRTQLIKRNCSHEEALKYQSAMQRAGAVATITRADDAASAASGETASPPPGNAAPSSATPNALSLAPAGTAVLLPSEQRRVAQREVDVSAFSLAPAGERLEAATATAPAPPDTSHLSAVDIGDTLPTLPTETPPPAPDTSTLSIAAPDSDLLEERYRRRDEPAAPSTAHLSVEPRQDD